MTQAELAQKLNISKSTLGHYEQGVSVPPPYLLLSISEFFNIPIDYLLGKCACTKEYSRFSDKFYDKVTFAEVVNKFADLVTTARSIFLKFFINIF